MTQTSRDSRLRSLVATTPGFSPVLSFLRENSLAIRQMAEQGLVPLRELEPQLVERFGLEIFKPKRMRLAVGLAIGTILYPDYVPHHLMRNKVKTKSAFTFTTFYVPAAASPKKEQPLPTLNWRPLWMADPDQPGENMPLRRVIIAGYYREGGQFHPKVGEAFWGDPDDTGSRWIWTGGSNVLNPLGFIDLPDFPIAREHSPYAVGRPFSQPSHILGKD